MNSKNGLFIIFPNTLFEDIKTIETLINDNKLQKILIIEDSTYFTKFKFHKQKLILHRSTMKYYYDFLQNKLQKIDIEYIDNEKANNFWKKEAKKYQLYCFDPIDHQLFQKIIKANSTSIIFDNLSFMETNDDLKNYKEKNDKDHPNKYRHDDFYKWNRIRLNVFLQKNTEKPLFGKWTFDNENRKSFPSNYNEPSHNSFISHLTTKEYFNEAKKYVENNFANNFGDEVDNNNFLQPITHNNAKKILNDFVEDKIDTFGEYQDAVLKNVIIGQHSFLSSALNIGLITAKECLEKVLNKFEELSMEKKRQKINNYEGFIRQLIGWRSYTRLLYYFHGKEMQKMNFFNHQKKLDNAWYNATTGIYPIDCLIKKVAKYAYLHHIERLMYIGNWALLTQIKPTDIYEWFMIVSIDSYEWVMVSNVFGMSQHALDNSKISMMTKPYFSSTNYLKNMSNFVISNAKTKKKKDMKNDNDDNDNFAIYNEDGNWIEIWNNLYYYFIYKNKEYLQKNYSTARQVAHWNKKSDNDKQKIIEFGNKYISTSAKKTKKRKKQ